MIKTIKKIFFNNILLKLTAVLISIIIWIIAVNIVNNKIIVNYYLKPELLNKDELSKKKIILLNEKKIKENVVQVKIQAARNDFKFIDKNIKAIVDFDEINSVKKSDIDIKILFSDYIDKSGYRILKVYPEKIEINLDNLIIKNEKIYYELKNEPPDGFYIKNIKIEPEFINISGAESLLKNLKSINLILDIFNLKKDSSFAKDIKIFDKQENDITDNLILSNHEVKFDIEIDKYKKIEIKDPNIIGQINNDYILKSIDYEPRQIDIIGKDQDLISELKIPDIDITGASLSKTIEINIKKLLPEDLDLDFKPGSSDKILIIISLEKKHE